MSENSTALIEPQIVEFGPYRVIGVRYAGKNTQEEIPAMWEHEFIPRIGEIQALPECGISFGLCRCLPGVTDGSFEYIAAVPVTPEAPVPEGMVEATIAAGTYAEFPVASLAELSNVWGILGHWLKAHPEWVPYCGAPDEVVCDCANHPGFELYPAEFTTNGKLFLYMPIHPRA